jgi:hypothetical protein
MARCRRVIVRLSLRQSGKITYRPPSVDSKSGIRALSSEL